MDIRAMKWSYESEHLCHENGRFRMVGFNTGVKDNISDNNGTSGLFVLRPVRSQDQ